MHNDFFKDVIVTRVDGKCDLMILDGVLTKYEMTVLHKLIQGFTHAEIGGQMFLSSRTVDGYAYRLRKKMGCLSNVQVVVKAINQGMFVLQ
jgi:DNA-binding CsgD family transcriptional regulator